MRKWRGRCDNGWYSVTAIEEQAETHTYLLLLCGQEFGREFINIAPPRHFRFVEVSAIFVGVFFFDSEN